MEESTDLETATHHLKGNRKEIEANADIFLILTKHVCLQLWGCWLSNDCVRQHRLDYLC